MRGLLKVAVHLIGLIALTVAITIVGSFLLIIVATKLWERTYPEYAADWQVYRNEKYGFEISYPHLYRYNGSISRRLFPVTVFERTVDVRKFPYVELNFVEDDLSEYTVFSMRVYNFGVAESVSMEDIRDYGCKSNSFPNSLAQVKCEPIYETIFPYLQGHRYLYYLNNIFTEHRGRKYLTTWRNFIVQKKVGDTNFFIEIDQPYLSDEIYEQIIKSFKFIE